MVCVMLLAPPEGLPKLEDHHPTVNKTNAAPLHNLTAEFLLILVHH